MRRILLATTLCVATLALSACGNKGPLVRATSHATAPAAAPVPAPATSAPAPAAATPTRASTGPAYLSPAMPATATSTGH
ncbi:MAG TPA: lipoprotein [Rhodanobacteraceae bacterium]